MIRSYALEANIRYVQVHGLPFRLGKYPPGSREEDRRALYNALRTLGQDAAGIIRKAWISCLKPRVLFAGSGGCVDFALRTRH